MAVQKVLVLDPNTNLPIENTPNTTSSGSGDAGKLVALDTSGTLDSTLFPAGIGSASQTFPTSEAITAGSLVNVYDVAGTATARNANATDTTKPAVGFVLASFSSGATATVYFPGQLVTGLSGLTAGARVFLGTTSGIVTATAPSTTGNLIQQVGYAVGTSSIIFDPTPGIIKG